MQITRVHQWNHLGMGGLLIIWTAAVTCTVGAAPPSGGGTGTYTIVDLRGPTHVADKNWSDTDARKVSNAKSSLIYTVGTYKTTAGAEFPCRWTVLAKTLTQTYDLAPFLLSARDVNSDGFVGGVSHDNRPAVWIPNLGAVTLPTPDGLNGSVNAITDLVSGVFLAVGSHGRSAPEGHSSTLWTVTVDGIVLSSQPLQDLTGTDLYPGDVNTAGVIAGLVTLNGTQPCVAEFVPIADTETLAITLLPVPDPAILRWYDIQLNSVGDVQGQGAQQSPNGPGDWMRAVVWSREGNVYDVSRLSGISTTQGNGIARVNAIFRSVGRAEGSGRGAFAYLFQPTGLTNLNTVSKGADRWALDHGEGINDSGHICGLGRVGSRTFQRHGFLLVPN